MLFDGSREGGGQLQFGAGSDGLFLDNLVIGADDVKVELRGDPHGVGIDQLFADVGARGGAAALRYQCWNSSSAYFLDQLLGLLALKPVAWFVLGFPTGCLVEVIQAVAAIGVGLHGNAGDYKGAHTAHSSIGRGLCNRRVICCM